VRRNVCGRGFVFDDDFVAGAKCCDKLLWICACDLVLEGKEGGSSA
jgi:hypothetical protein